MLENKNIALKILKTIIKLLLRQQHNRRGRHPPQSHQVVLSSSLAPSNFFKIACHYAQLNW